MKNNKGFTLIELLAIVIILAVIMVVAAPSMTKEIKKSEDVNKNILNQKIENAAHIYAAKYYANDIVTNTTVEFTLSDLVEDGLISFKGDICSGKLNEQITVEDGNDYDYSNLIDDNCIQ